MLFAFGSAPLCVCKASRYVLPEPEFLGCKLASYNGGHSRQCRRQIGERVFMRLCGVNIVMVVIREFFFDDFQILAGGVLAVVVMTFTLIDQFS